MSLAERIRERIEGGQFEVPLLPVVARQVLAAAGEEATSGRSLADLIHRDQGLAAQVLRIANSPTFGAGVRIVSLQQAVTRLGLTRLSEIAVAASFEAGVFRIRGQEERLRALWRHALGSGLFAKEVARVMRRNVEAAFLAGLLHGVGKPLVLREAMEVANGKIGDDDALDELIRRFHVPAGQRAASEWELPATVVEAIAYAEELEAPGAGLIARTVHVAARFAAHVLDGDGAEDEKTVRELSALSDLNLYPNDVDEILALGPRIREAVDVGTL